VKRGTPHASAAFFARLVDELDRTPEEIAYVGDRVDNDVLPALACGPWGLLHETPDGARGIDSLRELL
jgi:FMN phosphatase YigB (HAD superfamily)